ncbi:DUF4214 domain-containing protein [Prochlorococcus marinus]|uniref:Serine protease n=1 Tax=Prochlorococcus marinus XMU1408 TaxID=2213228 RepID=A0A318R5N1_PROMR|nr:DUF4214 domain-containing protein [Prochlorococcus marinus]MBW3041078.1 hypothetical protein [Prochlorococcus marinus str. XMU1408]PYE03683.1 hypothetical protein DNJ73_00395 [Prochlorococcus marinus XMU1408]
MSTFEVNDDIFPYRCAVFIRSRWGNTWYSGSGALIGNNDILTASHVIHNNDRGGLANEVRIYPTYDPDSSYYSSGYYQPIWYEYYDDWDEDGNGLLTTGDGKSNSLYEVEKDIALLSLSENLGSIYGYFGVKKTFSGGTAYKLGFPGKYSNNLMFDQGIIYKDSIDNYHWFYNNDIEINGGDSGGPIYINSGGDAGYQIIGVTSSSGGLTSTACSVDSHYWWISESVQVNNYLYDKSFASIVSEESVNEGDSISFTYKTHKYEENKQYIYRISGISSSDLISEELTGTTIINSDGEAIFSIEISADQRTEGSETFTLSIGEKTKSVIINDTSKNLSQSPTDIIISSTSFDENINANTSIASLSTIDPDTSDTFTYTLVSGVGDTDNQAFTINGSSIQINTSPDYETKSSYTIRVKTTDSSGNNYEKSFDLSVNNLEEGNIEKPIIYGENNRILFSENSTASQFYREIYIPENTNHEIYRFTSNKEVTWSISQGPYSYVEDYKYFEIDEITGSLTIKGILDYENGQAYGNSPYDNNYLMSIEATDVAGNKLESNQFRVIITDVVNESNTSSTSATSTELQQLYIGYFSRPCDPSGLDYWLGEKITKKAFAANMYLQPEFNSVNGNLSTTDQVNQIYLNLFNRDGDAAGLTYWSGQIDSGSLELASIANDLTWAALNNTGSEVDKKTLTHKTNAAIQYTYQIRKSTSDILAYQPASTSPWITGNNFTEAKTFINEIGFSKVANLSEIEGSISKFSNIPNSFNLNSNNSLINSIDNITGLSLNNLSNDFLESLRNPETTINNSFLANQQDHNNKLNYIDISKHLSNQDFISNLYEHVLCRESDLQGLNYWVDQLETNLETRYEVLIGFSRSEENHLIIADTNVLA